MTLAVGGLLVAALAALGGLLTAVAGWQKQRADRDREDSEARYADFRGLLDEYRQAHVVDLARIEALERQSVSQATRIADLEGSDAECQKRLKQAESRIAELGG